MSNKLLEEAVGHLRKFLPMSRPSGINTPQMAISWDEAKMFLETIDMKMDEENAKHQDVLREVSDQQCMMMSEMHNKMFPLQSKSPAQFREMVNMKLIMSLVLDGEL